jgi:hypothetical protein
MREFQAPDEGAKVMIAFFDALQYITPAFRIFPTGFILAHIGRGVFLDHAELCGGAGQATSVSLSAISASRKSSNAHQRLVRYFFQQIRKIAKFIFITHANRRTDRKDISDLLNFSRHEVGAGG